MCPPGLLPRPRGEMFPKPVVRSSLTEADRPDGRLRSRAPTCNELIHVEIGRHVLGPVARKAALKPKHGLFRLALEPGVLGTEALPE